MINANIEIRLIDHPEVKQRIDECADEITRLRTNLVEWQDRAPKAEDELMNDDTCKQCRKLRDQISRMNTENALVMDRALIAEEKLAKLRECIQ